MNNHPWSEEQRNSPSVLDCGGPPPLSITYHVRKRQRAGAVNDAGVQLGALGS